MCVFVGIKRDALGYEAWTDEWLAEWKLENGYGA